MKKLLGILNSPLGAIGVLIITTLVFAQCGGNQNAEPPPAEQQPVEQLEVEKKTEIANPASVNCEQKGGKLEMMEDQGGQFGVCVFEDGSRCEEWKFFRNECTPGTCREKNGICNNTGPVTHPEKK